MMEIPNIVIILFLCSFQYSQGQRDEPTPSSPAGALTQCGQTIFADNGTIQYKLNETYDAGELCVFVIQFETGKLTVNFTLENEGFSDEEANAILVSALEPKPEAGGSNLGRLKRNLTLSGYGAVVYFRTNSSEGTGFKLNFERESAVGDRQMTGLNIVFNYETASPLHIPISSFNNSDVYYTNYFFTSGSKMITEPGSYFRLTTSVLSTGNRCDPFGATGVFLFTLEQEKPIFEQWICDDFRAELRTKGLFIVHHVYSFVWPLVTGTLQWELISAT